jgi:allantoate deiminase
MNDHFERAKKIVDRINELAGFSEDKNCITRTFGTDAFVESRKKIFSWMKETGLDVRIDNISNVRGKLLSPTPLAKTLVIGSHYDTVGNAGKFDGPLGIVLGLDIIQHLIKRKEQIPFNIELIAFSDEEGIRFHTTYLGSKVVAGSFDKNLLEKKDALSITLEEAMRSMGGDSYKLNEDSIAGTEWVGYFEIHIEQGPILYDKNIPVGIVTGIAGQKRIEIIFNGISGHAGTVPMDMRTDALCAASEFILEVENFAIADKKNIVATVGKLEIFNAASNVIPGKVLCSLDLRSPSESILLSAFQAINKFCKEICKKRGLLFEWNLVQESNPVSCDDQLSTLLKKAIADSGYEVVQIVSGAGHDAVPISEISPVVMLFVRCFQGISHNPLENVELKDIAAAIHVSDNFIKILINKFKK